jgi:alanyl-tRNA synthetase
LQAERKTLERQLAEAKKQLAMGGGAGAAPAGPEDIAGTKLIARVVEGVGGKDLRGLVDDAALRWARVWRSSSASMTARLRLAVGLTDDLKGQLSAVELVRAGAAAVGGKGGGGRPDFAQAGGPDGSPGRRGARLPIREALAQLDSSGG